MIKTGYAVLESFNHAGRRVINCNKVENTLAKSYYIGCLSKFDPFLNFRISPSYGLESLNELGINKRLHSQVIRR
jgi:hypothetical protein